MSEYALKVGASAVDRLVVLDGIHAQTSQHLLDDISLSGRLRILDIGCGVGLTTTRLAQHFGPESQIVGIDRDKSQIEVSVNRNEYENIEYKSIDILDYMQKIRNFDIIYGRFVFSHNQKCVEILEQIYKNMKTGAFFVIEEPEIGTATTILGTGVIEAVEALYLSLGQKLKLNFCSSIDIARKVAELDGKSVIRFVQPVISDPSQKILYLLGLLEVWDNYIREQLISEVELMKLKSKLELEVFSQQTMVATARIIQIAMQKK